MPRTARQISETNTYHVILRGINRQAIFEEDDDYLRLLDLIAKTKASHAFELFGYCLMSNHIHLLLRLRDGDESLGQIVQRVATSYASWFNWKYERAGHLFQDRFRSEAVESDEYLLSALRYIHRNPITAGLCRLPNKYRWSSFNDYMGSETGLADTEMIQDMVSANFADDWRSWLDEFTCTHNDDEVMDIKDRSTLSDTALRTRIHEGWGFERATDLSTMDKQLRDNALRELKSEGFGLRQITRVTGIPYGIVRNR